MKSDLYAKPSTLRDSNMVCWKILHLVLWFSHENLDLVRRFPSRVWYQTLSLQAASFTPFHHIFFLRALRWGHPAGQRGISPTKKMRVCPVETGIQNWDFNNYSRSYSDISWKYWGSQPAKTRIWIWVKPLASFKMGWCSYPKWPKSVDPKTLRFWPIPMEAPLNQKWVLRPHHLADPTLTCCLSFLSFFHCLCRLKTQRFHGSQWRIAMRMDVSTKIGASTNNHMSLADHRWCEHTANHILINQPGYFSLVLWDFAQTRLNDHFASTLSQNQTRNLFPRCQTPHKLRSHPRSLPAAVKHHWLPLRSLTFEMYFAGTVPLIPGDKITSLALWKKGTPSWGTEFGWNLVSWSKLCLTGDIQNSKWSSHLIQAKTEKIQGHKTGNVPWLDHISTLFFALLLD